MICRSPGRRRLLKHQPGQRLLPAPAVPAADLAIMRRIDELHLDYPFAGSRMLRDLLRGEGIAIGRRHVATLMKRMGIEATLSPAEHVEAGAGHKIYPYLLRGLAVDRPNQVWAMDITYIPMARGFVYLAAVVDWFSRRVLAWRLSITMEVDVLPRGAGGGAGPARQAGDLQHRSGQPVHQRRLHRRAAQDNAIAISMDGKGAWRDNVFVERLWRSVKYEEVYLRAYDSVGEARASIGRYLDFYNGKRPHSSLDRRTPDHAYFDHLPLLAAA